MPDQTPPPHRPTPLLLQTSMRAELHGEAPPTPPQEPRTMPSETARRLEALLPDLRRVARRLSRNAGDADDLVQETLLNLWSRMAKSDGKPIQDLRAYALAALRNRAAAHEILPVALEDEPQAPPEADDKLACAETLKALSELPEEQADLLKRRAIDGQSYAEIADATGLPLGTVTSRLARGRAALCAALGVSSDTPVSELIERR